MAHFDPETGQLVLQIVYDGAAYSGKTESIESLGRQLKRPVESPSVQGGRTLMFDWLEYQGGVRFGRPIVCRVATVPGQVELTSRRHQLLCMADGILFVVDSRAESFHASTEKWLSLIEFLDEKRLKAAVCLQFNHRDADTALPTDKMKEHLGLDPKRQVLETIATEDEGIREAFVLTVSETLRRHVAEDGSTRRLIAHQDEDADTQPVSAFTPAELLDIMGGVRT